MEIYIDFVQRYREIWYFHKINLFGSLCSFKMYKQYFLNGIGYLCINNINNYIKLLTYGFL